jgi:hypothetical protein
MLQRTSTFLSPIDPRFQIASATEPRVATTAVDVRDYQLLYRRLL